MCSKQAGDHENWWCQFQGRSKGLQNQESWQLSSNLSLNLKAGENLGPGSKIVRKKEFFLS